MFQYLWSGKTAAVCESLVCEFSLISVGLLPPKVPNL